MNDGKRYKARTISNFHIKKMFEESLNEKSVRCEVISDAKPPVLS